MKYTRLLILTTTLLFCTESFSQTNLKVEQARAILDSIAKSGDFKGLSAAIAYKGEIVLADGFGYKNIETKEKPDAQTLFRIYSISKTLTGILAMTLVDEGKLDLNKSIAEVMPELPKHLHKITPQHFLAHLSGIRHYKDGWTEWDAISQNECKSPMEALEVFINDPLLFKPGEKMEYTSFGYVLLSAVLENAGGQPFTQLMQEKVFDPSDANRIFLDNKDGLKKENIATFYDLEDGNVSITRVVNNSCKFGGGGYNASAEAVVKILMTLIDRKLFSEVTYEMAFEQARPNDGSMIYTAKLGIGANRYKNGYFSAVSNGSGPGGRSTIFMYPEEEIAVVLLGSSITRKLRKDTQRIANLFLE